MPYMTGLTDDVEKVLFLRKFNVLYRVLAYCLAKTRCTATGWDVPWADSAWLGPPFSLPPHVIADEKHSWPKGEKLYCATTVANGCILGANIAASAGRRIWKKPMVYSSRKRKLSILAIVPRRETPTDGYLPEKHGKHPSGHRIAYVFSPCVSRHPRSFFQKVPRGVQSCFGQTMELLPGADQKLLFSERFADSVNGPMRAQYRGSLVTNLTSCLNRVQSSERAVDL